MNRTKGMFLIEPQKLYYLAGLFDGEGCIYIANCKGGRGGKFNYRVLRMIIANTNKDVIDWLVKEFGGRVQVRESKNPKHSTCYYWLIERERAKQLLMLIYPYTIIKRETIEEKLKFT